MSNRSCRVAACLALLLVCIPVVAADDKPQLAELAGYLSVPHDKVDAKYNGGFSMYVAAWPL